MKTENTILTAIECLLKQLKVKYTRRYLQDLYDLNPYKDNFFGISNLLSEYKIKTAGYRVKNKNDLSEISYPAIATVKNEFVVLSGVVADKIVFSRNGQEKSLAVDEFIAANNIVLTCEKSSASIEPDYMEHRKQEIFSVFRNFALIASLVMLSGVSIFFHDRYTYPSTYMLLALNALGVYTGILLLQKQMHIQNDQADKLCSLVKKGNCSAVLHSSAAKFMGVIGWSEFGFGYFITGLFILLFIPSLIPYLGIINCCALPYTLWSIWYQKFKAKQWCILCLIVQTLFWLLFVTYLMSGYLFVPQLFVPQLIIVACVFALSILSVNILIPYLAEKRVLKKVLEKYNKLKINDNVFRIKLLSQKHYEVNKNTSSILFGNRDAQNLITVVSNPHCAPCAVMHKRISNMLATAGDKICVQYIFSAFTPNLEKSSDFLTAVYFSEDISLEDKHAIYDEWFEYGKADSQSFFKKYNISFQNELVEAENQKHTKWKQETMITLTPTVLFNGYRLPEEYTIEDLLYFTDLDIEETK